jgi:hypothetical protein
MAFLLSSRPAPGVAARDDDVDAIISRGVELRRQGNDREALAEFQRAAKIARTPRIIGQIGLAETALGIWVAADQDLRAALQSADDPWIRKNHSALETARARVHDHVATLEVWGTPEGAEVIIQGRPVGHLPLPAPITLSVGVVTVTVQAKGYQPTVRQLQVFGGQLNRENVDLIPLAQLELTAAPPSKDSHAVHESMSPVTASLVTAPTETAVRAEPGPVASETAGRPLVKRWWFWTIVGVVVAGGVVATAAALGDRGAGPSCPMDAKCVHF